MKTKKGNTTIDNNAINDLIENHYDIKNFIPVYDDKGNENDDDNTYDDETPDDWEYLNDCPDKLPPEFHHNIATKVAKNHTLAAIDNSVWRYHEKKGYYKKMSAIKFEQLIQKNMTKGEIILAKSYSYTEIKRRLLRNMQIDSDTFNTYKKYINCKNGVVKVKTNKLELYEHSFKYHFTYCINAKYLPKANLKDAPNFMKFCETSLGGNKVKIRLLLQMIGYLCSDMTGAKKAFFFYGEPDSGKSIMTDFIRKLIGPDVVSNIPIHELGDKFSKAGLYGMKINIYSEMKNTKIPDISTFKSVTSGDTISGEYKNQDRFSFDPKVKLLYAGNSFPFSKESDHTSAFLNRICILIFGKSIPVDKQDKNLSKKLWKERDVIFSLAMEELRKLKKNKFQFVVSEDSKKFLQNYEKMQNSVDSFVEEFCEFGKDNYLAITNFRNIYSAFCHENAFEVLKDEDLVARLHGKFITCLVM